MYMHTTVYHIRMYSFWIETTETNKNKHLGPVEHQMSSYLDIDSCMPLDQSVRKH